MDHGISGKVVEQERARELKAEAGALAEIASEPGVSKSSVSIWVRDVDFEPRPCRRARKRGPNKLAGAKAAETERYREQGIADIRTLPER